MVEIVPRAGQRARVHVRGFDVDAVDAAGPIAERGIAAGAHVRDDLAHALARGEGAAEDVAEACRRRRVEHGIAEALALALACDGAEARRIHAREPDGHAAP